MKQSYNFVIRVLYYESRNQIIGGLEKVKQHHTGILATTKAIAQEWTKIASKQMAIRKVANLRLMAQAKQAGMKAIEAKAESEKFNAGGYKNYSAWKDFERQKADISKKLENVERRKERARNITTLSDVKNTPEYKEYMRHRENLEKIKAEYAKLDQPIRMKNGGVGYLHPQDKEKFRVDIAKRESDARYRMLEARDKLSRVADVSRERRASSRFDPLIEKLKTKFGDVRNKQLLWRELKSAHLARVAGAARVKWHELQGKLMSPARMIGQTLAGGLDALSAAGGAVINVLGPGGVVKAFGGVVAAAKLANMALNEYSAQAGLIWKGIGAKLLDPFVRTYAGIEQKFIPLELVSGRERSVLEEDVQKLADLPALDYKSALDSLLDMVVADPERNVTRARDRLETISNAVFSAGGDPARVELTTLAIKQMLAKGIVAGEEVTKQLSPNIPGVFQFMKETFGSADTRELKSMGVSAEKFVDELVKWLKVKYPRLPASPQTLLENFADRITRMQAQIGKGAWGEMGQTITAVVAKLDEFLQSDFFKNIGTMVADTFGLGDSESTAKQLEETLYGLQDAIITLQVVLGGLSGAVQGLSNIWTGISKVYGFITSVNPIGWASRSFELLTKKFGQVPTLADLKYAAFGIRDKNDSDTDASTSDLLAQAKEGERRVAEGRAELNKKKKALALAKQEKKDAEAAEEAKKQKIEATRTASKMAIETLEPLFDGVKQKTEEIIYGGSDARRVLGALDLGNRGKVDRPINVQVNNTDVFGQAVHDVVYSILKQLQRQGAIVGGS